MSEMKRLSDLAHMQGQRFDEDTEQEGLVGAIATMARPMKTVIPAITIGALLKKLLSPTKSKSITATPIDKLSIGDQVKVYKQNGEAYIEGQILAVDTNSNLIRVQATTGLTNVDTKQFKVVKQ